MRRLMHSSSNHGCSLSICSCSTSSDGTSTWGTRIVFLSRFPSCAPAPWEGVKLFFLIFSSLGGAGGSSSFLLFFAETDSTLPAIPVLPAPLRGRPPLAPLARLVARRCTLASIEGRSMANASRRAELLRCCPMSSPPMCAASALNRRASSLLLSDCVTMSSVSRSIAMFSVVFMVTFRFYSVFNCCFSCLRRKSSIRRNRLSMSKSTKTDFFHFHEGKFVIILVYV